MLNLTLNAAPRVAIFISGWFYIINSYRCIASGTPALDHPGQSMQEHYIERFSKVLKVI
jgi:hypothetical protein